MGVMANLPASTTAFPEGISEMKFCVRVGLFAAGDTEVNFLETQVKITVNLAAGFRFDNVNVTPKDKSANEGEQGYQVDAFTQGATILVCMSPGATALASGVVLKSV